MHDSPRSGYHSAASIVAHLRADMPPLLRQVYWAGFSNPCCNVFKPFYFHGAQIPSSYAAGSSTYSADSPWWWANRVKLLCDLNSQALRPTVRGVFELTEQWEMQRQKRSEAEALNLIKEGREKDAVLLLQGFVNQNCARVEREYRMLNQTLPMMLDTLGVRYVFVDYLKSWSSGNKVPLPIR